MNILEIVGVIALVVVVLYTVMEVKKYLEQRNKFLKKNEENWKYGWDKEKPKSD